MVQGVRREERDACTWVNFMNACQTPCHERKLLLTVSTPLFPFCGSISVMKGGLVGKNVFSSVFSIISSVSIGLFEGKSIRLTLTLHTQYNTAIVRRSS